MVNRDRGGTTLGCLLWILLAVILLYYGVNIGEVYLRYFQLRDEMRSQVRLAPSLSDDVIRRRLVEQADELGLPDEAHQFVIRRTTRPARITIRTTYSEQVDLPFFEHTFVFEPEAEAPL